MTISFETCKYIRNQKTMAKEESINKICMKNQHENSGFIKKNDDILTAFKTKRIQTKTEKDVLILTSIAWVFIV